jgi:hypothetical protein
MWRVSNPFIKTGFVALFLSTFASSVYSQTGGNINTSHQSMCTTSQCTYNPTYRLPGLDEGVTINENEVNVTTTITDVRSASCQNGDVTNGCYNTNPEPAICVVFTLGAVDCEYTLAIDPCQGTGQCPPQISWPVPTQGSNTYTACGRNVDSDGHAQDPVEDARITAWGAFMARSGDFYEACHQAIGPNICVDAQCSLQAN